MSEASTLTLCKKSDVEEDEGYKVDTEGLSLAVFHVEGEFFVMDDLCSHGPGSLSQGYLDGYNIECDFHAGCFDIRTGEVTAPPCMIPMKTYKVVDHPEDVIIEWPES
ncbi:MAG: (2Fe-2S)-binding protein [Rhodospirillaceae bacterium]|nr:(2Fe-2S)-binding protein [Rhodospirillaceae bacterium]|tara:strand:- start:6632 stop:6955 length:324 start_codon:yes stop_codon:yes gene_type:complete